MYYMEINNIPRSGSVVILELSLQIVSYMNAEMGNIHGSEHSLNL